MYIWSNVPCLKLSIGIYRMDNVYKQSNIASVLIEPGNLFVLSNISSQYEYFILTKIGTWTDPHAHVYVSLKTWFPKL